MRLPTLALLALTAAPLQADEAIPRKPLTAETMWAFERLAGPAISPDGRHAVAAVTRFDVEADKGISDLWLYRTDGSERRRLTTHASNESSPVWSPDGRWIAFVAQRDEDKAPQLYVLPLAGGEALRLTEVPTGVSSPKWYGDSKSLAFISRVWPDQDFKAMGEELKKRADSKMTGRVWETTPVTSFDVFVDERQAHLYQITLEGGAPVPLTLGTGLQLPRSSQGSGSYDLHPKDGTVVFVADSDPAPGIENLDLFRLVPGSREAINLTPDNEAPDTNPQYSPDGRWLAYGRQTIRGFYGDNRRLMLQAAGEGPGSARQLHVDWDRSVDGLVWKPDSSGWFGAIDDAGTVRVYDIPREDRKPVRAVTEGPNIGSLAICDCREATLVGLSESFSEPPTLVRIDARNGRTSALSTHNDARVAAVDWGRVESMTYAGANEVPIQTWVIYPPGFDPAKRWPLLLMLHGGPHNAITNTFQWRWNAQIYAGLGYVVAWHNFHGSSGFGQAFTDSINPAQDALPYEDTIRAAHWFAAQPWIDRERMAAAGASYGGYLGSILLGREHPFQTLVIHAPVYNWYTQTGADYYATQPRFGEYWEPEQAAIWRQASPHYGAANFRTPALVSHGQLDYRVPVNHGIELYQTLQRKGIPSKLIYFPNENHWILKPQNSLWYYGQVIDWIGRYAPAGAR